MEELKWKGYNWITQERWGKVHHEKPNWWYDGSCVSVDENDYLHLRTKLNPKYFPEINKISWVGVGLVSCKERFGFGKYSVVAKLPRGANLWPAFWMWGWDSWPPEIDVFEGYSNSRGSYLKPRILNPGGFWNVQTNLHYTEEGNSKMEGGKNHFFGFKDPSKNFIEYSVLWQRDSVKFYYDGRMVREINDKEIMDQLSRTKMNVIINNGVTKDIDITNPPSSDFIISDFKFEKS